MPTEPPPSDYRFTPDGLPDGEDLVGVGGDLEPGTVLMAYRSGVFPMPVSRHPRAAIGWWSPDPRGVLPIDGLRVSRSLRASCRRYEIRVDTAYDEMIRACADVRRPGGWIRRDIRAAYTALHELGWAHSVEAWAGDRLVGGLYGVALGKVFFGESMFNLERDASKVAFKRLVDELQARGYALIDCQVESAHLGSLGARLLSRAEFVRCVSRGVANLEPPAW